MKRQSFLIITLGLLVLALAVSLRAETVQGRVRYIVDGDTFQVRTRDKQEIRIRLAEIDAPERQTPWSRKATEALTHLIEGRELRLQVLEKDRYGRLVATVWLDDLEVNRWMVEQGHAWVSRRYVKRRELLEVEREARLAGRGFWALPEEEKLNMWLY